MTLEAGPDVVTTRTRGRDGSGAVGTIEAPRRGRWIDVWDPENATFWVEGGRAIARRNLWPSIFAEFLGFSVWQLWSIVVVSMPRAGFTYTTDQLFWLVALPSLVGATLRLPYTFAVPRFGGRNWTVFSALLLLVPTAGLSYFLTQPDTPFWLMALIAATAGVGGGNFASSMTNISFFYPEGRKGFALGINAAGGNLGVAVTQLIVPLVIIIGVSGAAVALPVHEVHLGYAGLVFMPFIALAAFGAWRYMDSLTQARTDTKAYAQAIRQPQTWIMSLLYIGTFGSFIGYSFALPLVIKNTFPEFLAAHTFIATYLAGLGFVGALIGSLARPLGGWLADRVGGARVTLATFVGMALATAVAVRGVDNRSFATFFGSYMVLFLLA